MAQVTIFGAGWQRLKQLQLTDLWMVLGLNGGCSLINAVANKVYFRSDWSLLWSLWGEFFSNYCVITFSLLLFYLWRAPSQLSGYNWRWFSQLLLFSCFCFFLLIGIAQDWFLDAKVQDGFFYSLSYLAMVSWMLLLVLYLKKRVLLPKLVSLTDEISHTRAERDQASTELQLLQAQLEPHFFFNTLANLHNLIDLDPDKAKRLLEELTAYLRDSIPQFRRPLVALQTELRITERYLQIQQIRFNDKFSYQLDICPSVRLFAVLPMSVLTLVENAIKHGLEKKRGQGLLVIRAWQSDNQLWIEVEDSAAQPSHHCTGTGLSNLRERLQAAFGQAAGFYLTTEAGVHTRARFHQPVILEVNDGSHRVGGR